MLPRLVGNAAYALKAGPAARRETSAESSRGRSGGAVEAAGAEEIARDGSRVTGRRDSSALRKDRGPPGDGD